MSIHGPANCVSLVKGAAVKAGHATAVERRPIIR
jgi:hypothetical protein